MAMSIDRNLTALRSELNRPRAESMKMSRHSNIGTFLAGLIMMLVVTACAAAASSPEAFEARTKLEVLAVSCQIFPDDNIWNARIDSLPLSSSSDDYIESIGADEPVHPDFGSGLWEGEPIGIPFIEVPASQPLVAVNFVDYGDESDPGPYPIPGNAPVEGGPDSDGDRHVIVLQEESCLLYELFYAFPQTNGSWEASSGAKYDLGSNTLRPEGWTSADAAGLPILPGLVRYEEVAAGEIKHALRFTAPQTRREYVWPARHFASDLIGHEFPPMGQRFRLRASFDYSGFSPEVQVILRAMKVYGIILADNGSPWFISGAPDDRWDNEQLVSELFQLRGRDFEAVDSSSLIMDPDSGRARRFDNQAYLSLILYKG